MVVVDEDDNGKFKLERVNRLRQYLYDSSCYWQVEFPLPLPDMSLCGPIWEPTPGSRTHVPLAQLPPRSDIKTNSWLPVIAHQNLAWKQQVMWQYMRSIGGTCATTFQCCDSIDDNGSTFRHYWFLDICEVWFEPPIIHYRVCTTRLNCQILIPLIKHQA